MANGRAAAVEVIRGACPDLLFAAGTEASALGSSDEALLELAPLAVLKRGRLGATVLYREEDATRRFEVASRAVEAPDTTGAGDAFDAGFILGWLAGRRSGAAPGDALRAGAVAGNRLAIRHLMRPREELVFG
jgi:sugar/nucleoside kinase (ribokinase family)